MIFTVVDPSHTGPDDARGDAGPGQVAGRDDDVVARFVERFAATLADAGFPRMPARAFVTLLTTDSGHLTAAELAEKLQVSPAAVSGAVRYLVQVELASRSREPGSRRDHFVVHDDVWYEANVNKGPLYRRWSELLRDGAEALGEDTPAGARISRSRAFFDFLQDEMPALLKRWREYQADRLGEPG
ncbi:MAG: GbsR/MarR family transcriptional regulator [Micromonosporaceae bacterium]